MADVIEKDLIEILKYLNLDPLKNKTVVITGSNGLIGTYLVRLLVYANVTLDTNIHIIGVSRSKPNRVLSSIEKNRNLELIQENLDHHFSYNGDVDYIIHAATYAQPQKFLENKLETIHLNTTVTERLLEICKKKKSAFLFISSSEIYGNAKVIPTPEDYNGDVSTTYERAPYSESKRLGETICSVYTNDVENIKIGRVSSVYGPGITIDDKRVMGNFLKKAFSKQHIDLLDDGAQSRAWLYVSDCVVMLMKILLEGKELVYNIGGQHFTSIKEIADIIAKHTNSKVSVPESSEAHLGSAPVRVKMDMDKFFKELQFIEKIPMDTGLEKMVQWNRELG